MSVTTNTKLLTMQVFQGCQFDIDSLDWKVWESPVIDIAATAWQLCMKQDAEKGKAGVVLRYLGVEDKIEIHKIQAEIGKANPINDQMKGQLTFAINTALGFNEFISLEDLKKAFEDDGGKLYVYFSITAYASMIQQSTEEKIKRLTRERNSLHKSLHSLTTNDQDAAVLTDIIATQPEVAKAYEFFKNEVKTFIFDMEDKYGEEFYGMLEDLSTRVQRQAEKKYTTQAKDMITLLDLDEGKLGVVAAAIKSVIRRTYTFGVEGLTADDMEIVMNIVLDTKMKEEKMALYWGKFVYALTKYQFGNPNVFVNWEAIGNTVKFNFNKHRSIERKLQKDAECRIIIPELTTRSNIADNDSEDEDAKPEAAPLSPALVIK